MSPWTWALLVVVMVLVAALVYLYTRRRTQTLRQQFGPEYDHVVEQTEGRRAAEAALQDRARRRSELHLVPLSEPERLRYTDQWRSVQERFVDRPDEAVDEAERLLTEVMEQRGYPVADFDEQAELLSVDHAQLVQDYRIAHDIRDRQQAHMATTEDQREALLRYRSMFGELLRGPGDDGVRADGRQDGHDARNGRDNGQHRADTAPRPRREG